MLVSDKNPEMPDTDVALFALEEGAFLLTSDKDFLRIINTYPKLKLILFRFVDQHPQKKQEALRKLLPYLNNAELVGKHIILSES